MDECMNPDLYNSSVQIIKALRGPVLPVVIKIHRLRHPQSLQTSETINGESSSQFQQNPDSKQCLIRQKTPNLYV